MPLVYANVAVRNWHAFVKLGVSEIYSPYGYFSNTKLDYPVSLGGYRNPRDPSEPMLLHLEHLPLTPNQGLSNVEQFRRGRQRLLNTPFEEFEKRITDQLDRMLGRRIPIGARHRRDHRESLAARLLLQTRIPCSTPRQRGRIPMKSDASAAAASRSPIPMRVECLHARGDRSGMACDQRPKIGLRRCGFLAAPGSSDSYFVPDRKI
jgi:hypothetical protein